MKLKRTLAIVLTLLLLSSVCPVSVFALPDETAEGEAQTYTLEELTELNARYGYGLTETQMADIAAGNTTLEDVLGDREEPVVMIVQLSPDGVLSDEEDAIDADGDLTAAATKAQLRMEKKQEKVQTRIENTVLDGEDLAVMYNYTLLTNAFAIEAKPSQLKAIAAVRGVASVYTAPIWQPVPTDAETESISTEHAANYFTGSDNTTATKGTGTVISIIDTGLDCTYSTLNTATNTVTTTFHPAFRNSVDSPKIAKSQITSKWTRTKAYSRVKNLSSNVVTATKNSIYRSTKVPFAFNYADDSFVVGHAYPYSDLGTWANWTSAYGQFSPEYGYWIDDGQGDHGTHVAGIIAGYETDSEGKVVFEGVAPDAQIMVMKVFGYKRAGNFADILAAMEDSILLGADVINLSLGSWAGFTYGGDRPDYDAAFQAAANAGIVVCTSAGNDYTAAKGSLYGTDKALASNPDNGIISAPASYDDNLAVASMASKSYYAKSVTVDGRNITYTNNATEAVRSIEKFAGSEQEYAILKDSNGNMLTGKAADWENYAAACRVNGKFAVIRRGETFTKSVACAEAAGAIGLIVCDNADGGLISMMENVGVGIPAIFISKSDGDFLAAQEANAAASHKIQITNTTAYVTNPLAGQMSDFSSWGVTPDLKLKPEITGYGGNVYSTLRNGKYGLMSGTSMSSPYLAGVSALVVQNMNGAYSAAEKQAFAKAVMMSTATPVINADAGIPYSPRQQGAGLVNIDAALASKAYVTVPGSPTPKLDLGDDKNKTGVYNLTFNVVNTGAQALTFDVSAGVQTEKVEVQDISYQTRRIDPAKAAAFKETGLQFSEKSYAHRVYAIDELENVKFMSGEPYDLTALSFVDATTVTVLAGETVTVTVTVTLGAGAKAYMDENFVNGIYIEGFITLTSRTEDQPDLHVPYMGFYGDWTQAPMLDEGTWEDNFLGNPVHPQMDVSTGANIYHNETIGDTRYPLGTPNTDGIYNPYKFYAEGGTYLKDVRNVFGGTVQLEADAIGAELALLRSAKDIRFTVTNTQTGQVYYETTTAYVRKTIHYSDAIGMINGGYFAEDVLQWDGTIQGTQNRIAPGTQVTYTATILPDYGTEATVSNANNTFSFNAYYDGAAPTLDAVEPYLDETTGDVMLHVEASDDTFVGEISYGICGYYPGNVEKTVNLHTMCFPEHAGDTVETTLNLSQWARESGLVQMRSVCIGVEDYTQKQAVNPNPVLGESNKNDYYISFFDHVKVHCATDILPVGAETLLNVDHTYGEKIGGGDWSREGANNSDYGVEEDFIFESSNPDVLRITASGKLIPVSAGYADVTATGRFGKSADTMRIRVIEDPVQLQIAAAHPGDTITLTDDVAGSSLLIQQDTVIDLNGHTLHGVDGYPAIRVCGGNVVIKNGAVDAKFSAQSENALLTDILEDNAAAIRVEGGSVTLDGLTVTGATFVRDGETVLAGSAVVQTGDGSLTVKASDLRGLYAVNNSTAAGTTTVVSGNFEGILGAVADMKKVAQGEGSTCIDVTNALAEDDRGYLGTVEGSTIEYHLPTNGLFISAQQLAAATLHGPSTITYDAERDCAILTFNTSSSTASPDRTFLEIPGVNIANAQDYTFAAILSNGLPAGWDNTKASFSSGTSYANDYLAGEENAPLQDASGTIRNYVKPLALCTKFVGNTPTLYFWPAAKTSGGQRATMDIYGIALFNNRADAASFVAGKVNAYTNNLKVAGPQSFNTQLLIDGTTLHVSASFSNTSDGTSKWTANELELYTRTTNSDNTFNDTFVAAKPITPDENGNVSVSFADIDPSKVYVVKVKFALSLTADSKASFFSIAESSAAALVKAFPDLLDEMMGVDAIEEAVADLAHFFLFDLREGFVARDARHYDCPLGSSHANEYPYIDEYPDIICRNANNSYTTWTSYWDKRTFNEFIGTYDGTGVRKSFMILFAAILGDAKVEELMTGLQDTIPAATWEMLHPDFRVGHYGQAGSVPTYQAQLAALKASAVGATPREQLVSELNYLANHFIDLYASLMSVINSLYTPGVTFVSFNNPSENDSLLNVLAGKKITTAYNYGGYNDKQEELIELVDACYAANDYTQNAKAGLVSAMNAALYGTLSSYKTNTADLLQLYFDENAIPGGAVDLGVTATFESEANYDGYITYELNGGVNAPANPIGYQRSLPVTFAVPTKEGYTFDGWYTDAGFADGTAITATTAATEGNLTLYAKWRVNSYNMTFMNGSAVVDTLRFTYGAATHATDALNVTEGLTFKYWYETDPKTAYTFAAMPAHDVTLHAQFGDMSVDDFRQESGVYVWPKENDASLHLTVDRDCTIDFGGKTVSNRNDLAIITVENGATVTVKNAVFQPADAQSSTNASSTIAVTGRSELTLENCVVRGAKTQDADFYAASAVKVDDGTVTMNNCVVSGLYAVDNVKGSGVSVPPTVSYTTGIYTGLAAPFSAPAEATGSDATTVDVTTLVNDPAAAAALASKVIVAAPNFTATAFDYTYLSDTDEVRIDAAASDALTLPDGSAFVYLPQQANVDGGAFHALTNGSGRIGDFHVGDRNLSVTYNLSVNLNDATAAALYQTDDCLAAASAAESPAFDALLPAYDHVIERWNANKDQIISKFAQYADNAILAPYLQDLRTCIDNISGTGSTEGLLPQIEANLLAYKALTTDAAKLQWLLENKDAVIALTVDLQENMDRIAADCLCLNALAMTSYGVDYSDQLARVFEMNDESKALRTAAEKQPSIMAAAYAAAENKEAFVAGLLNGPAAYDGSKTVQGTLDVGAVCSVTAHISKVDPVFTIPTFTVLVGTKLRDVDFGDARYAWVNGNVTLNTAGNVTQQAVFTHENTEKYNPVTFDVPLEVITPATYCARNGHSYVRTVVDPSCTANGEIRIVCSVCGANTVDVLPATGHTDANNDNVCDSCGAKLSSATDEGGGFFGWLRRLFQKILNFFRSLHF